jgi:AcrR family transcriptional regulator
MKPKKDESKKENILRVTLELLKQKSVDEISIREIASIANVNVASINYYFSSKEVLFNEALDLSIVSGINQWIESNIKFESIHVSDLNNFILFLHLSIIQHPSIGRTRIINLLNTQTPNQVNLKICETIYKIAGNIYPNIDNEELKIKVSLVYGSLANMSCSVKDLNIFLNVQLESEEVLSHYIDKIMQTIF